MPEATAELRPSAGGRAEEAEKRILFSKYELGRLVGRGAFAKVYHGRELATGKSVAVKCISKQRALKSSLSGHIEREIAVMSRLRHPHIVRPIEVLASRDRVYFVMEFAKGGELYSRIAARGRLPEDLARRYFRQLVSAVAYCHARGVFHRDLKPENLLLDENADLKVSDFGLAGVGVGGGGGGVGGGEFLLNTLCGTPAYVAPEILARKSYDGAKVDVWSCGVVLFVLVAGYLPFNDPNLMNMYRKIYRGDYRCPKWFSPDLRRLLSRLLHVHPETRITVDEILADHWFKKDLDDASLARFRRSAAEGCEEELLGKRVAGDEDRELNAFDIITSFPGFDLSCLLKETIGRRRTERFVSKGSSEDIVLKVEEVGGGEGLEISRKGERRMGLVMKTAAGFAVAAVEVYRINAEMAVVEVEVEDGGRMSEKGLLVRLQAALVGVTGGSAGGEG